MPLELDIDVLGRGFQSSNNTSANGMYFKTGYQPDNPQYSNSTMMYISNSRRIGVKTITPLADFHVAGTILCKALIQSDLALGGGGTTGDPDDPTDNRPCGGGPSAPECPFDVPPAPGTPFGPGPGGSILNLSVVDSEIFVRGRDTHGRPRSLQAGDMWWDTDDDPPTLYIAAAARVDFIGAGGWEIPSTPIALIDPNVTIWNVDTIPTSAAIGDVWLDSGNNWLAYRAESVGANEILPGEWVLADDINDELQSRLLVIRTSLTGIMADSEVITYFNEEAPADGFMRFLGTHSNASFGDIWIDTSEINRYAAEFLTTNAINRWANSTGGFIDSNQEDYIDEETGHIRGMAWRAAPTDAIGVVYLNTYLNKNVSDRKTTTYYSNSFTLSDDNPDGGRIYGPNSVVTPTGIINFNPQYDTWYDISPDEDDNPENQVFVYLVNSTFDYANSSNTGLGSWGRKMFKTEIFDLDTSETGWWNARDAQILRTNSAFVALNTAFNTLNTNFGTLSGEFTELTNRLEADEFTIPFADREVKAFFSTFDHNWGTGFNNRPIAGGNNDIWILTDHLLHQNGAPNTDSILVSVANQASHTHTDEYDEGGSLTSGLGHHWKHSPNNALGTIYLNLYSSGSLGEFSRGSNWMPRGYSLWDEPESDYSFLTNDELPGIGEPYVVRGGSAGLSIGLDSNTAPVDGSRILRINTFASPGSGTRQYFFNFANNSGESTLITHTDGIFDKYGVNISPGKRWILSWYSRANSQSLDTDSQTSGSNTSLVMDLWSANSTSYTGYSNLYVTSINSYNIRATDTWQRDWAIFDFQEGDVDSIFIQDSGSQYASPGSPLSEINRVIPLVTLVANADGQVTYGLDSIQLEQVGNNIFTPSQFKEPSDNKGLLFGRRITDGKILTHSSPEFPVGTGHPITALPWPGAPDPFYYGPIPNVDPNGAPNPEPHGDLWFNTSNNNLLFRYFQNNINNTAQSAYYTYEADLTPTTSNSGWYVLEDNRFGLFYSNIISMNTQINDALANLAVIRTNADHDIVTFFAPEDGTIFANAVANPSANFGDIWINTIDENANLTHGGLTPNAIFRYQNGTSFHADYTFGRTTPPVGSEGPLAWYHAPEDSLGVIYLATAQNRNVADQKTVTYFENGADTGAGDWSAGRFGPNVAITPAGVLNPNPKDDLWIDTANGNALHIYKGNHSFSSTYAGPGAGHGIWDRYVRYGLFEFGPSSGTESGWYSVQDSQIGIIRQDLIANATTVGYALANSVDARAIADNEIISYYEYEGATGFVAQSVPLGLPSEGNYPSGVSYGDIWINPAYWNTLPDGSLSTNAILRYQNTTGGSANAFPSGVETANLSWNFAPNNAIGRVFLDAYLARNLADRKTTVFYTPNTEGQGPNPNTTPSGLDNSNPEGDLWIDTAEGLNRLYVYKTNSSFLIGNYFSPNTVPMEANAWAQTVHSDIWDSDDKPTGWWDAQDSEISLLRANVGNILTDIGTISSQIDREVLAYFQPESDVPIASGNNDVWILTGYPVHANGAPNTASIYASNSSPQSALEHGGSTPDPDDDTFITDSGGSHWIPSPNNAIGKFYLESYSAGITGQFARGTNIMPRGLSLFDQPTGHYVFHDYGSPSSVATVSGLSDTDQNLPYPMAFNFYRNLGLASSSGWGTTANLFISSANSWIPGSNSLVARVGIDSKNWENYISFNGPVLPWGSVRAQVNMPYIIDIPKGKKWIFSCYVMANVAGATSQLKIITANSTTSQSGQTENWSEGFDDLVLATGNTWYRHELVIDLRASNPDPLFPFESGSSFSSGPREEVNGLHIILGAKNEARGLSDYNQSAVPGPTDVFLGDTWHNNSAFPHVIYTAAADDASTIAPGEWERDEELNLPTDYYFNAFQLEEVADNINEASEFKEPSDNRAIIFGREITDGKVVTHYSPQFDVPDDGHGPTPHITPSGLPNPEPHGDFWINTTNNNMLFVYNQNATNHTAQTANYSYYDIADMTESGWYTAQDQQIGWTYANVVDHAANIEHLFANTEFDRSLTDHDVVGFFETHEATHFQNAIGTHPTAAFGDIWINVHGDNQWANGSLNPNAIFRWQNTSATGANTHAAKGNLVWEHTPNNLTGQVYLATWLSRNIADRKTVIYFEGNTFLGGAYFGPNVATLPGTTDAINPNPDGDLWMDTGGSNRLYIYKTNSSFEIGNYEGLYTDAKVWAQTTHNAASAGGPFDRGATDATGLGGWWDAQGFDSSAIDSSILANEYAAANALANAQFAQALAANAQAIADGEIISFYAAHNGDFVAGAVHPTANYGDIWIDIHADNQLANGALHPDAIYRYQNSTGGSSYPSPPGDPDNELGWYQSSNSAIGKVYLDAWKSQNTADAKVVTYIAPGTPLGTVPALYGPDPSSTPGGVHNPNPENDLWLDSNDNNRIYRYQVIGTNTTSVHAYQTPNNTHSGWADVRDARIGDFPFAEHRKAYVPMNEWSVANVGYGEELVMWDESDNLNHARYGVNSSDFSGDHDDFVDTTIKGIPTKALNRTNSIATVPGPSSPTQAGQYNKDIGLLRHDAIRNANQQSYSFWFKPTGSYQRHGHRIISRDASDFWAVLIGTNATHFNGETGHYNEFYPADGSYVNVAIQGAVTDSPTGEGRTGSDACFSADLGAPGGVLKYNTWNHIAFTLDYKGDDEYGNSVWYFANEDDGWENANVFYLTLDKDASANHNLDGEWTSPTGGGSLQGRGVAINNSETSNVSYNESLGTAYAPVAHYSEFRYYDTFLSQASIKKLFDNPTGIEESSQGLLRTIRSQAVADGEIISFYSIEGGDFVRGASHPTANFGDIWIDTSVHNEIDPRGGLIANAINRYQNTSFGASPSEGTLVWEATPNNSVGKVYLDAAWARNLADQKTVTYYAANINSTHGPNVAITSSGTVNPNPESDLWIDTNTNRLYIYKTNGVFSSTYVNPDSGTDQTAWAQTVHSGAFLLDGSSFSGWWDVQDTELRDYITINEWAAANALAAAATSQAAADREILAFFEDSEDNFIPVGSYFPPDASGNGDVWIQTDRTVQSDGSPNYDAIYIANTKESGAHYIDMGKNRVPPVLARWSGDPDPLNGDYEFTTSPGTATRPHTFYTIVAMHGEVGNPAYPTGTWPAGYANTTGGTMSTELAGATASGSGNTARVEIIESPAYTVTGDSTSNSYFSGRAFHMKSSNVVSDGISQALEYSPGRLEVYFGNNSYSGSAAGGYPAWYSSGTVPLKRGKRWIISYYVKSWKGQGYAVEASTLEFPRFTIHLKKAWNDDGTPNTVLRTSTLRGETDNTWYASDENPGVVANWKEEDNSYVEGTWTRKWRVIDLTSSSNTYYGYGGFYTSTAGEVLADSSLNSIYETFTDSASVPGAFTQTNATIGDYFKSDAPTDGRMSVVATGTVGPTHNVEFGSAISGRDHNVVRLGMFANTWASATDPTYPPAQPAYSTGATFSETNGEARAILRWKTSEDPEWGGADGRQTAREWFKNNTLLDDTLGQVTVYWRNHRIPEWRERNITGISLQFYGDMTIGDQYDLTYVFMGPSSEAKANEIDTMLFNLLQYQSGMEWYIDGLQVEEVAAGVTEPSDLWYPDGAHYWHPAPNNAIGKMYLESYADGISGAYQRGDNIMPRAYSLFDHVPVDEYDFMFTQPHTVTSKPYPIGFSVNSSEERASINTTSSPPVGTNVLKFLPAADPTTSINPSGEREWFSFANTHGVFSGTKHYGIVIPTGKKWILSAHVMANTIFTNPDGSTNTAVGAFLNTVNTLGLTSGYQSAEPEGLGYTGASSENFAGYPSLRIFDAANEWKRVSWTFDLNSSASTSGGIDNPDIASPRNAVNKVVVRLSGGSGSAPLDTEYYYAGIQLEEVEGHVSTPSTFREPSDRTDIVFGRQITDGKIVTHYSEEFGSNPSYGPTPHITPSGLPNPEPHGDFWINTTNSHMMFRYHQNNTNFTAQTANYAYYDTLTGDHHSGWYTGQDEQIIWTAANTNQQWTDIQNSLAQTSFAQSRIDTDIASYFYPNTTTVDTVTFQTDGPAASPIEFGDIWISTGAQNMHANGTLSRDAIHRAQNGISGSSGDLTGVLYWRPAPNNAVGQVYLETWATKNSSDRRTATYLSDSFGAGGTHGPNVWTMDGASGGVYNGNPEGDFWLNTRNDGPAGAPNNQLFIYKTNSSWTANQTAYLAGGAAALRSQWAQTIHSGTFTFTGPSETGWWDATDTRVNAAFVESERAIGEIFNPGGLGDQIEWAFGNAAFNRTEADHDRVILYYAYDSHPLPSVYNLETSVAPNEGLGFDFIIPGGPGSGAAYGDIWINNSGVNQLPNSELHVNAIHRVQNSIGGSQGSLGWYRANTNQLGRVYLDAYLTRNISDRKTAIFLSDGFAASGNPEDKFDGSGELVTEVGYFGPNVSYTDPDTKNIFNPNPDGDLWYDTTRPTGSTVPRNVLYVYKTNASFQIGNNSHLYTEATVWAQTVHSGVFDSTEPTGWWDVKDSRLSAAGIAADREIVAFFQPSTWADKNDLRGNGDIWIQTDYTNGGANTGSIFRYDTRIGPAFKWVQAPNNGIGLAYLKGYGAAATSSGNIMPRGYALFDAPDADYGGDGASQATLDTVPYPIRTRGTYEIDRTGGANAYIGTTSLKVISSHNPGTLSTQTRFGSGASAKITGQADGTYGINGPIRIPKGRKWIFSFYSKAEELHPHGERPQDLWEPALKLWVSNNHPTTSPKVWGDGYYLGLVGDWSDGSTLNYEEANKWQRFATVVDLRDEVILTISNGANPTNFANTVDLLTVRLDGPSYSAGAGNTVWYDGFQLEEVAGDIIEPSSFKEPSDASATSFGRVISDGKIVAHFEDGMTVGTFGSGSYASTRLGPIPTLTPNGLDNPDPNGDMWIDTANGNPMYQYYTNSAFGKGGAGDIAGTTAAQRVLYVKPPRSGERTNNYVGWISTQDTGIAAANLAAYNALGQLDNLVVGNKVFIQGLPIPVSLNKGDIWFNTDDDNKQYVAHKETSNEITLADAVDPEWVLQQESNEALLFALAGNDPFYLNPLFGDWPDPENGIANNWIPLNIADVGPTENYKKSDNAQSGDGNNKFSLSITGDVSSDKTVSNRIAFPSPLFGNSFITGVYVGRVDTTGGIPGLVITLEHHTAGQPGNDVQIEHHQATMNGHSVNATDGWEQIPFRAVPDLGGGSREITAVTFSFGYMANSSAHVGGSRFDAARGTGTAEFDQIYFDINHPNMRIDRFGSIVGTYIADASIGYAHIVDAAIDSAKINALAVTDGHISNLSATKIQTGTIGVGVTVGGDAKVFIDGATGRIIIRD